MKFQKVSQRILRSKLRYGKFFFSFHRLHFFHSFNFFVFVLCLPFFCTFVTQNYDYENLISNRCSMLRVFPTYLLLMLIALSETELGLLYCIEKTPHTTARAFLFSSGLSFARITRDENGNAKSPEPFSFTGFAAFSRAKEIIVRK